MTKGQEYAMGKRVSSINGAGKTGQLHAKERMLSYTIYKDKLKMD